MEQWLRLRGESQGCCWS